MRIDHVIHVTADIDAGTAWVEEQLGVPPTGGGRHDGMGTINRIVPVGGGYVEILAIADRQEAAGSPFGAALMARIDTEPERLAGWAVAVDDVAPFAER